MPKHSIITVMFRRTYSLHAIISPFRYLFSEVTVAVLLLVFALAVPAGAGTRFEERGLFMHSVETNARTSYVISLRYMSSNPVGSLDFEVCESPIFYDPCVVPAGFDFSAADLSSQLGETGYSITRQTGNQITLSRSAASPAPGQKASYTFSDVRNPSSPGKAFSIRLRSYASQDASGSHIDFGSVRGQITAPITIETQVPPMLIFCMAQQVEEDCSATDNIYYRDLGQMSPTSTLTAQSQMAVGTNASQGFVITASGSPPSAGTNQIAPIKTPTVSRPGTNQFGINLVANNQPRIGADPEGPFTNAVPTDSYSQANYYIYNSGDVVAHSPNVSLMRKFTVSYIINSSPDLRAGVYSTTITFIASGRF